jgi:hypothetical protein
MKKILLIVAVLAIARVNAQVYNAGFENWDLNTSYFTGYAGTSPGTYIVSPDTFTFYDPAQWTSANAITGDTGLGGYLLVSQTNVAHSGSSAIKLTTDTLLPVYISALSEYAQLVVPGLVLNGKFPVSGIISETTLLAGGAISPAEVPGAGQPFTQKLDSFSGYYQYAPVFNPNTNSQDTCLIWATLRKGSTVVANAIFKSQATVSTYTRFSVPFVYLNCEDPDTLVILMASSLPVFSSIISGSTGLAGGSVLMVDDLNYDTLPANRNSVFAVADLDTVNRGDVDTINVLGNDISCDGVFSGVTVTIRTAPVNGTATVLSNNEIAYTGNSTYLGLDSLLYTDTDASGSVASSAWLKLVVNYGVGISEANEIAVKMFPVPASDNLHLQFANSGKTTAHIYDVVGNLVSTVCLTQNDNNINVAHLANGAYGLQLVDESNTVIARTKFVVSR